MLWLLGYTLIGAVASSRGDSLVAEVGRALDRISTSSSSFNLVPGLRFEHRREVGQLQTNHRATLFDSAENVFTNHDLVWDVAPGLELRIYSDTDGFHLSGGPSSKQDTSRTFGVMRRMKMVLLPIMYKLGVITTLLTLLTVFALKGLTLGVLLLVITSAGLLSKLKVSHHEGWSGHQKDVHVHVHGGTPFHHHVPWDREGGYQPYHHPVNQHGQDANQRSPWESYIS